MVELINLRNCIDWGRPGDIKIDRTTIFGNPFPIGECIENGESKFYTRESCISRYAVFISGSGDKRGHGKTPLFRAGMKRLPLCKVPLLSAANNYVESHNEPKVKK